MSIDVYWHLPILQSGFRELWPYGPGSGAFQPSLGIGLDASIRKTTPILAPVDGRLVVVPTSLLTCAVLLLPDPAVMKAFVHDGIGELAFYIHPLDLKDLISRYTDVVTRKLPRKTTKQQQLDNLAKGLDPIDVKAGDEIAFAAPVSLTDGSANLELEVMFAPRRGSYIGITRALTYAKRLADPTKQARRMDPMAFYFTVKRGLSFDSKIAASHAAHPVFTSTSFTRRGLVEIRQEHDDPIDALVNVSIDGGPTMPLRFSKANWGHLQLITPATSGQHTIDLERPSWVFTDLPSGALSNAAPTFTGEVPFHWATQSIYMEKQASSDSWFVENGAPLEFFSRKNQVEPLVDGFDTYKKMIEWLQQVRGLERFMWLAGWWCDSDFPMIDGDATSTLQNHMQQIDASGAQVRVLAWQQGLPGSPGRRRNSATVDFVNGLSFGNGSAILDGQTRAVGSHHQKFMVTYVTPDQCAGFCGGIDINPNRMDNGAHSFHNAYHDTHAFLRGPAIADLIRLFGERWNDHASVTPARQVTTNWQVNEYAGADCYVQVTRTIPKGTHASQINGVQGTYNAVLNAVQRAQRYIYIEDQYLVPYWGKVPYDPAGDQIGASPANRDGLVKALTDALKRIQFLLIVIPGHLATYQMKGRRYEFLETLRRAAGADASKIHVYYLTRPKPPKKKGDAQDESLAAEGDYINSNVEVTPQDKSDQEYMDALGGEGSSGSWPYRDEIYVHSKVWIIDDVYVKCGSMNVNRRGFTYDTEADFHAVDGALRRGKRRTALAFRNALFSEHARKDVDDVPDHVEDVIAWWIDRAGRSGRVAAYDDKKYKFGGTFIKRARLDVAWNKTIDPDGSV